MKQKLKLHLWRTGSTVHLQIIEQEGIDENLSKRVKCLCGNGIFDDEVRLRGFGKRFDNDIENKRFDTEQQAIDYINKVVSWLDEIFPAKDKTPFTGETVLVSDDGKNWGERIFISSFRTSYNLERIMYLCVADDHKLPFRKGEFYKTVNWRYMKPLSSNWNEETGIYEAEREI